MNQPPPVPDRSVLAIDNIALDLPLAGVGSRVLAASLDQILVMLLWLVVLVGGAFALGGAGIPGNWVIAILVLAGFVIQVGFFAVAEIATKGLTPGKKALRLRTIGSAGGTPTTGAFLIRNLLRVIDTLIGVPMMAIDPRGRRLGDHLAGTLVVHQQRPEEEIVLGAVPPGWSARQVALAESYLLRADELTPDQRNRLGRRLVAMVQRDAPELLQGETVTTLDSDPAGALRRVLYAAGDR